MLVEQDFLRDLWQCPGNLNVQRPRNHFLVDRLNPGSKSLFGVSDLILYPIVCRHLNQPLIVFSTILTRGEAQDEEFAQLNGKGFLFSHVTEGLQHLEKNLTCPI